MRHEGGSFSVFFRICATWDVRSESDCSTTNKTNCTSILRFIVKFGKNFKVTAACDGTFQYLSR